MSYQQKKTLVMILSGVILFIVYCTSILPQYQAATNASDLKFWAIAMLSFIGVSIIINIVIQIVFHILLSISIAVNEKDRSDKAIDRKLKLEMVEDERDHIIELKSLRVGYYFMITGLIASIFSLALGYAPAIMLNILFLSCMLGSIIEGMVQYYFYSKD